MLKELFSVVAATLLVVIGLYSLLGYWWLSYLEDERLKERLVQIRRERAKLIERLSK